MKSLIVCCLLFVTFTAYAEPSTLSCAPKTWSEKWPIRRAVDRMADIVTSVNSSLSKHEVGFLAKYNQAHETYGTYIEDSNKPGGLTDAKMAKVKLAETLIVAADYAIDMAKINAQYSQLRMIEGAHFLKAEALRILASGATPNDIKNMAGSVVNQLRLYAVAVLEPKFDQALHPLTGQPNLLKYDYRIYQPQVRVPIGYSKLLGPIMAQFDFVPDQDGFATGALIAGSYTVKFAKESNGRKIIRTASCVNL